MEYEGWKGRRGMGECFAAVGRLGEASRPRAGTRERRTGSDDDEETLFWGGRGAEGHYLLSALREGRLRVCLELARTKQGRQQLS